MKTEENVIPRIQKPMPESMKKQLLIKQAAATVSQLIRNEEAKREQKLTDLPTIKRRVLKLPEDFTGRDLKRVRPLLKMRRTK